MKSNAKAKGQVLKTESSKSMGKGRRWRVNRNTLLYTKIQIKMFHVQS